MPAPGAPQSITPSRLDVPARTAPEPRPAPRRCRQRKLPNDGGSGHRKVEKASCSVTWSAARAATGVRGRRRSDSGKMEMESAALYRVARASPTSGAGRRIVTAQKTAPRPSPLPSHPPTPMTSPSPAPPSRLSYRASGVDIDAGDALVERIKPFAATNDAPGSARRHRRIRRRWSRSPSVTASRCSSSGTDGVGTKLKLAFALDRHDTIGIDLVAMSVNDILVQGAEPLFFLDYFVCERLDVDVAADVIKGIAAGLRDTPAARSSAARPPSIPTHSCAGEYDLAGFAVGVVGKSRTIDGTRDRRRRRAARARRRAGRIRTASR